NGDSPAKSPYAAGGSASQGKPGTSSEDRRTAQANQWLAEARRELSKGNYEAAAHFAGKVEELNEGWDVRARGRQPWADSLFVLRLDIQQAAAGAKPDIQQAAAAKTGTAAASGEGSSAKDSSSRDVARSQAKQRALQLLLEARTLQNLGKLIEARQ